MMMECKKGDCDDILLEQKALRRSSYKNRKECIKKKTMELATLCGINACTIIYGPHGDIESWPENPKEAKAIIDKFKDFTSNPNKRVTVIDESRKKVIDGLDGEVVSCQEDLTQVKDDKEMGEKSSHCSRRSSLIRYQEFLKKLDSKLGALTKRIEFLRSDQEFETNCCCVENEQLEYSENTGPSPKRRRISQELVFLFDLNYPPPDEPNEPESSCLSSEDYKDLRLGIV